MSEPNANVDARRSVVQDIKLCTTRLFVGDKASLQGMYDKFDHLAASAPVLDSYSETLNTKTVAQIKKGT